MSSTKQDEYNHIVAELKRYEVTNITIVQFFITVLGIMFLLGTSYEINIIIAIIPLVFTLCMQYICSLNYAYRIREKYLIMLDKEWKGFYSTYVKSFYHPGSFTAKLLVPFNVMIFTIVSISLSLSTYSFVLSLQFLKTDFAWYYFYLICNIVLFAYTLFSFTYMEILLHKKTLTLPHSKETYEIKGETIERIFADGKSTPHR